MVQFTDDFLRGPPRAPWAFYFKAFALGAALGSVLEFAIVKSNYCTYVEQKKTIGKE